jgi:hypothetical protein
MQSRGFDIEAVPLRENAPLKNLECATLIAAIQIQQMLHDRDGLAARPMTDVFEPANQPVIAAIGKTLEGRTARQRNPPTLFARPCDLDLRPSRRMDWILRQTRANRAGQRSSAMADRA